MTVRYDDAFAILVRTVEEILGGSAFERGLVLRDAAGRLAFAYDDAPPPEKLEALSSALKNKLKPYAREDRVVIVRSDVGASRVLDEVPRQWLLYNGRRIRYVDRRLVGVDWLASPSPASAPPPRFVFSSLKGGVGRTTALCIAAADLASEGKNVLVVDLDIEAPGLGTLLLSGVPAPRFGTLDYLAESSVSATPAELLPDLVATSSLTNERGGRVDVAATVGTATQPENYLGKLARALLDTSHDGSRLAVREKVARLVDELVAHASYDVVLVDARAGLAEITAGALLGLGASVLLFGVAQQQTIDGYRLLFAHLSSLVAPGENSPWDILSIVQAKTTPDGIRNRWFREEMHALFQEYLYEETAGIEDFNFDVDDATAPHYPIAIAMNPLFADWDPASQAEGLTKPFYDASFRPFLDALHARMNDA